MKTSLFPPKKLNSQKIPSVCWLSLMYDDEVLMIGDIILFKWLEISLVGQLQAEKMSRLELLGLWILGKK